MKDQRCILFDLCSLLTCEIRRQLTFYPTLRFYIEVEEKGKDTSFESFFQDYIYDSCCFIWCITETFSSYSFSLSLVILTLVGEGVFVVLYTKMRKEVWKINIFMMTLPCL